MCLYQTKTWVGLLFRFWLKNRVPRFGLIMTISSTHQRRLLMLIVGENEVVGSLWGVCLKSEYGRPCGDVSSHTRKISCLVGHPLKSIARIAQQQQQQQQFSGAFKIGCIAEPAHVPESESEEGMRVNLKGCNHHIFCNFLLVRVTSVTC